MTATCSLDVTAPRAHSSVCVLLDTQETEGTVKVEFSRRYTSTSHETHTCNMTTMRLL